MGTLFSALDIASSGLRTAQVQLDVAAHNIANSNTEGYSRQRAELVSRTPTDEYNFYIGRGVNVDTIVRIRDEYLDVAIREQLAGLGQSQTESRYYALIEDAFQEPTDYGIGTRINDFFDALSDFANNVEETSVREALVAQGEALGATFNELANRFSELRVNANEEIVNLVPEINSIAAQIADLNSRISRAEYADASANDLRDRRDVLVDELAEYVDVSVREDSSGQYSILVGSDILVDTVGARELEAVTNSSLDPDHPNFVEIQFVDTGRVLTVSSGELAGAFAVRDGIVPLYEERADEMAATIIQQINSIHSQGNGLENLSGTLTSSNEVSAPGDALVSAGLPFDVTAGTFDLVVYDGSGAATTTTITITAATTLNDLAASLNGVANFSASVSGNQLDFGASSPYTFSFANDSTGALTALGVNGFFTGSDAESMAVNEDIVNNVEWLTSGYSTDPADTGDNTAALDLAEVRNVAAMSSGTATISQYFEGVIARLGVDAQANSDILDVQEAFVADFEARRQEVSGVSIDEEVTSLILFQRAYEASARIISIADEMLETLINVAL